MSSTEDVNNNKKKQNSVVVTHNNNNVDKELLHNPFVKDLLVKIDVLKNGVIKERKLNSDLDAKCKKFEAELEEKNKKIEEITKYNKKLEEEIVAKTNQMQTLIQEKTELEKKAKAKKTGGFFSALKKESKEPKESNEKQMMNDPNLEAISSAANAEIKRLNEIVMQLKEEKQNYLLKMTENMEQNENIKAELNNEIQKNKDSIKYLEEENKMLKDEKTELQDRINLTRAIYEKSKNEADHLKNVMSDHNKAREEAVNQLNACLEKYNKLLEENEKNKKEIEKYEVNQGLMAKKLSELKNYYVNVNLRNQMFHVKKSGFLTNAEIDVIFGKGEDGNYVMRIDNKKEMEIINIQDVESVNRIEKSKNKVEINYMLNGKKYHLVVIVPELVVDQFVEAYKNFYFESMKNQSKINY